MERSVDMDENRKVDVPNNEENKDCGWSGREVLQIPGSVIDCLLSWAVG